MSELTIEDTLPEAGESLPTVDDAGKAIRYAFDDDFQKKIAAMALRDVTFMQRTDGLIKPEYFENLADASITNIVLRYFKKYKKVPEAATFATLLKHEIAMKTVKPDMARIIIPRIKELRESDISDRDFVIDQVATFARYQAVSKSILDAVHRLEMHDFDSISTALQSALDVGAHPDAGLYKYGEMIETRTEERLDRAAGKLPPTGISTGYAGIDNHLYHKGWGRRELSVLMGGAKAGKTTALITFGINAAAHLYRYNVLYVTLEVSSKIIAERMDANISNQLMFELGDKPHEVKEKVSAFKEKSGEFNIIEFPAGTMTVSDLRRVVEHHKAKGIKYDLIIVDYADLMAPERFTDSSIENSKSVYVALRGFAMQEDLAVLTATQTNREGAKAAVAKMTDIAEDFNKVRIADVVISINKTDEERSMNQARLFFAACRNQPSNFSIRIEQDIDRMRFCSKVVGAE
jgi:replicative DNA helicase